MVNNNKFTARKSGRFVCIFIMIDGQKSAFKDSLYDVKWVLFPFLVSFAIEYVLLFYNLTRRVSKTGEGRG